MNNSSNAIVFELNNIQQSISQNKKDIQNLKEEIDLLRKLFNRKLNEIEDHIVEKQQKSNEMQIITATNDVKKEVMSIIEKDIAPKLERTINYMRYQMQDGDEIVTEYRKRLLQTYNPDLNLKKITDGKSSSDPKSKHDFQSKLFMFTDED